VAEDIPDGVSVLIVDDEENLADMFAAYIHDVETVDVAYGGAAGKEAVDDSYDVVLLDRLMPPVPGDDVLEYMDAADIDCRVALVTAVDPDFDIVELSIDDYLVKPVSREELRTTVRRLARLGEFDERRQELTSKKSKRNALKIKKSPEELDASEKFDALEGEIEALEAEIESISQEIDVEDIDVPL